MFVPPRSANAFPESDRLVPKTTIREKGARAAGAAVVAAPTAAAARQTACVLNRMTVLLMTTMCAAGDVPTALVSYFRKASERLQGGSGGVVNSGAPEGLAGGITEA